MEEPVWFPTSPLKAIRAKAPGARCSSIRARIPQRPPSGETSDVAIVFAYQWESEGMDLDSLSLT